jgi:hypothetical protein
MPSRLWPGVHQRVETRGGIGYIGAIAPTDRRPPSVEHLEPARLSERLADGWCRYQVTVVQHQQARLGQDRRWFVSASSTRGGGAGAVSRAYCAMPRLASSRSGSRRRREWSRCDRGANSLVARINRCSPALPARADGADDAGGSTSQADQAGDPTVKRLAVRRRGATRWPPKRRRWCSARHRAAPDYPTYPTPRRLPTLPGAGPRPRVPFRDHVPRCSGAVRKRATEPRHDVFVDLLRAERLAGEGVVRVGRHNPGGMNSAEDTFWSVLERGVNAGLGDLAETLDRLVPTSDHEGLRVLAGRLQRSLVAACVDRSPPGRLVRSGHDLFEDALVSYLGEAAQRRALPSDRLCAPSAEPPDGDETLLT